MSDAIVKYSHDVAACIFMHQFIGLDAVIAALNRWRPYHRSHISRMRMDRFNRIIQLESFTVFILGAKQQSVPIRMYNPLLLPAIGLTQHRLVVSRGTNVNYMLRVLSESGLIPANGADTVYISTSGAWRLQKYETMGSIGAGNLSHFYLRTLFLGSSGMFLPSLHLRNILKVLLLVDTGTTHNTVGSSGSRSKRHIFATARITDPSNSEQQVLSSHKAAADAERAAVAARAAAARLAPKPVVQVGESRTAAAHPEQAPEVNMTLSDTHPSPSATSQSHSISQRLGSRSTTPALQFPSSDDDAEGVVKRPKGKRKAIGMSDHKNLIYHASCTV